MISAACQESKGKGHPPHTPSDPGAWMEATRRESRDRDPHRDVGVRMNAGRCRAGTVPLAPDTPGAAAGLRGRNPGPRGARRWGPEEGVGPPPTHACAWGRDGAAAYLRASLWRRRPPASPSPWPLLWAR